VHAPPTAAQEPLSAGLGLWLPCSGAAAADANPPPPVVWGPRSAVVLEFLLPCHGAAHVKADTPHRAREPFSARLAIPAAGARRAPASASSPAVAMPPLAADSTGLGFPTGWYTGPAASPHASAAAPLLGAVCAPPGAVAGTLTAAKGSFPAAPPLGALGKTCSEGFSSPAERKGSFAQCATISATGRLRRFLRGSSGGPGQRARWAQAGDGGLSASGKWVAGVPAPSTAGGVRAPAACSSLSRTPGRSAQTRQASSTAR